MEKAQKFLAQSGLRWQGDGNLSMVEALKEEKFKRLKYAIKKNNGQLIKDAEKGIMHSLAYYEGHFKIIDKEKFLAGYSYKKVLADSPELMLRDCSIVSDGRDNEYDSFKLQGKYRKNFSVNDYFETIEEKMDFYRMIMPNYKVPEGTEFLTDDQIRIIEPSVKKWASNILRDIRNMEIQNTITRELTRIILAEFEELWQEQALAEEERKREQERERLEKKKNKPTFKKFIEKEVEWLKKLAKV